MVKNNLLSLVFHAILSLLIFCLLWFTKDNPDLVTYIFGSIAGKIVILAVVALFYYGTGRLLKSQSWLDVFSSSLLLFGLGVFFLLLAYGGLAGNILHLEPAQSLWNLPLTLLCLPYTLVIKLLGLKVNLWTLLLAPLFPSCIFSLSQGVYLLKRRKKKKRRELKERRETYV